MYTCNNLGFHQHHKNDNRNAPSLNVYKAHLYLNNEYYKNDKLDGLGEMYYQGLQILRVWSTHHSYTNAFDLEISVAVKLNTK